MTTLIERGYLIVAVDTADVDYVACARTLAKSIKHWHPDAQICLLSDRHCDHDVFDHVRVIPAPVQSTAQDNQANDPWCFSLSPFHETIKLEADMIVTGPIDHWWTMLRHRDLVLSVGCLDHQGLASDCRYYRKVFDENQLLDVYNAVTYWRYSKLAKDFFDLVKQIFQNWGSAKQALKWGHDQPANTDLVYALAADVIGRDLCHIPDLDWFRIAHLKHRILDLPSAPWHHWMTWEMIDGIMRINGFRTPALVHYHEKDFVQNLETCYD